MKKLIVIVAVLLVATSAWAMKYRVQIDMSFADKNDAVKLMNCAEGLKDKSVSLEPSVAVMPSLSMPMTAVMSECRHDEVPPQPCTTYESIDFKTTKKNWAVGNKNTTLLTDATIDASGSTIVQ